jgi:hypothetical protein
MSSTCNVHKDRNNNNNIKTTTTSASVSFNLPIDSINSNNNNNTSFATDIDPSTQSARRRRRKTWHESAIQSPLKIAGKIVEPSMIVQNFNALDEKKRRRKSAFEMDFNGINVTQPVDTNNNAAMSDEHAISASVVRPSSAAAVLDQNQIQSSSTAMILDQTMMLC